MNMTLEQFLQGAAIYAVISILAVAWFVRIRNSAKKDDDDFNGMA